IVRIWLTGLRAGAGLREPHVGVGRADHRDAGAVQDRDLQLRAAGVEGADHADDAAVPGVVARVGLALGRVPGPRLRRGVVTRLVADLELAGLVPTRLQHEVDRLAHLHRLRARSALQRQVRDDQDVRLAGPAVADLAWTGRRRDSRDGVLPCACECRRRYHERSGGYDRPSGPTTSIHLFWAPPPPVESRRGIPRTRRAGGRSGGNLPLRNDRN